MSAALSWDFPLPKRVSTILLDKTKVLCGGKATSPAPVVSTPTLLKGESKANPVKSKKLFKKTKGFKKKPYQRSPNSFHTDKPPTLLGRIYQLRGMKGANRNWSERIRNWRQGNVPNT
jgi:hypothetical protein